MKGDRKKRPGRIKNLASKKVDSENARGVKGGFNPQPEPPLEAKKLFRPRTRLYM